MILKPSLKRPGFDLVSTGEEISGPPGPKLARLLAFAGAGVIFALAANKWRAWEAKSMEEKNQMLSPSTQSNALLKKP